MPKLLPARMLYRTDTMRAYAHHASTRLRCSAAFLLGPVASVEGRFSEQRCDVPSWTAGVSPASSRQWELRSPQQLLRTSGSWRQSGRDVGMLMHAVRRSWDLARVIFEAARIGSYATAPGSTVRSVWVKRLTVQARRVSGVQRIGETGIQRSLLTAESWRRGNTTPLRALSLYHALTRARIGFRCISSRDSMTRRIAAARSGCTSTRLRVSPGSSR